jgi:hypothetical protein
MADEAIFDETQRLHQNMVVRVVMPLSLLFSVGLAVLVLARQGAGAGGIAATIAVGVVVPLALAMLAQRTEVTEQRVRVRSVVGWGLTIPTADVVSAEAIRYNPIGDCGGWGLRRSRKHGLVLNLSGDRGVLVRYAAQGGEKSALIGSRRSDELARAIVLAADVPLEGAEHGEPLPAMG